MSIKSVYKTVASLNMPAIIYLVISMIMSSIFTIVVAMCLKDKEWCDETTTIPIVLLFVIMVLAFTWLLNLIYSRGYRVTAWLLLIFVFPMGFGIIKEDGGPGSPGGLFTFVAYLLGINTIDIHINKE